MVHQNIEFMRCYSAALQAGQAAEALPFYAEDWDQYAYDEFFADGT